MTHSQKGKLIKKIDLETGTSKAGKEWKKQDFVIDTGDKYNPLLCFTLFGEEKIAMINDINVDDVIEVSFNLSSREYNGRFYHSINAWKIDKAEESEAYETAEEVESEKESDLPF